MRTVWMFLILCWSSLALAADAWTVLPPVARGVDADVAASFRDLLEGELATRSGARFVAGEACRDLSCARQTGQRVGAAVAVLPRLSVLGQKTVVVVTVVDSASGATLSNQRMSVDRVEDLEAVAQRMAEAITTGQSTDETAELGQITEQERTPAKRRKGLSGLSLRLGGASPFGDSQAAGFGILVDGGFWYEANDFAIEPRVGYRFSADGEEESWGMFAGDFGAFWILTRNDFAPFLGGGAGIRHVREDRLNPISTGTVVRASSNDLEEDSGWGPGVFTRVGIMFFRTYAVRMAVDLEYDVTFVDLHDNGPPQSFNFGVRLIF
ncbi:MAG: hypothetical protein KC613_01330 [Myxococcales bacterium]|nr:hypothetical protein [Myxococcales bacterium]MCB9525372.1 hypothetical protein [Myxococcales bacterium]